MNKFYINYESRCIQDLRVLIGEQKHRTLVLWVVDCAKCVLPIFENKYPSDKRLSEALKETKKWIKGDMKCSMSPKVVLSVHDAANGAAGDTAAYAAARAVGYGLSVVYSESHSMDFVFETVRAFVYDLNQEDSEEVVEKVVNCLYERLRYYENSQKKKMVI